MENNLIKKLPPRNHFAKLHERIQVKYEEMQRKLERSRSMDALHAHTDNSIDATNLHSPQTVSDFEINIKCHENSPSMNKTVILEELDTRFSAHEEIDHSHTNGTYMGFNEIHDDDISIFSFANASLESLNEDYKDQSESPAYPKAPPRVRLRDKIAAARERKRKKKEEEKKDKENKKKNSTDKVDNFVFSNTIRNENTKNSKRIRTANVTIALIDLKGLDFTTNEDKNSLIYCKFRLGLDKYKSKLVKCDSTTKIGWLELFNLDVYDEFMLEISLWSKDKQDTLLGRKVIDLSNITKENTHEMKITLESEENKLELFLLLTISGTYLINTILDLNDYYDTQYHMDNVKKKFAWYHLAEDYSDVGYLSVLVYGAKGLSAHCTYCVLELGNNRLQTHTENKTTDPNWMKVFNFTVTDITSILEISICDEIKKSEVIGKLSIPLLRIKNGEQKWYALKDKSQKERAKGNNPRIFLEMRVTWHPVKASIRVINPKEVKYLQIEEKFDRRIFVSNVTRCKAIVEWILEAIKWIKTCFEWESRKWSFFALIIWLLACWFFQPWMVPLLFILPFIWYRPQRYRLEGEKRIYRKFGIEIDENELEAKVEKEEKKTLRERLNTIQEITQTVQNGIGKVASIGESIKNLVNFTVPYLSVLAIVIIVTITFVVYLIPVKYIFMAWGINKFTRKIRRPNRIPNNEVLDLLSRVPDDETLLNCEELPLDEDEYVS